MTVSLNEKIDFYYQMLRIRIVEETIADAYPKQKMRTPIHLSIGQEAAAVASGAVLKKTDYAVSSHRAHGHYLAKGGDLKAMIAEIHGKVTGCCRGRGGSMHLIDQSVGFMGSTAIVANTIPIGVGLGLSIQLSGENKLSCIYLGDGAIEEGVFYESLNFAVLKKLPVLFVCENNFYSVYTPLRKRQPINRHIHAFVKSMGANVAFVENGYDVIACYDALKVMSDKVRAGCGPGFVEIYTYRYREHCGPNYDHDLGYRSIAEYETWRSQDSIDTLQKQLGQEGVTQIQFGKIKGGIEKEIEEAFLYAEQSALPEAIDAISGQYASVKESVCVS